MKALCRYRGDDELCDCSQGRVHRKCAEPGQVIVTDFPRPATRFSSWLANRTDADLLLIAIWLTFAIGFCAGWACSQMVL